MKDDREHVITALHAMRGVDIYLCSYAESGKKHDLDSAIDAAKRLTQAMNEESERVKKPRRKHNHGKTNTVP